VAFQVLPNIVAQPKPIVRWQYAAASVLFGLTLLSATQLGLLANISKLPKVRPTAMSQSIGLRYCAFCIRLAVIGMM